MDVRQMLDHNGTTLSAVGGAPLDTFALAGWTILMTLYLPSPQNNPEKPGGEDWLVNSQNQLIFQFKPDTRLSNAQCSVKSIKRT